jgi:hypothetical protein
MLNTPKFHHEGFTAKPTSYGMYTLWYIDIQVLQYAGCRSLPYGNGGVVSEVLRVMTRTCRKAITYRSRGIVKNQSEGSPVLHDGEWAAACFYFWRCATI